MEIVAGWVKWILRVDESRLMLIKAGAAT